MKNNSNKEIIYGVYVRKSSESEERQVQSLDRQRDELEEYIKREGINVYPELFEEEQSAFHPGREQFGRLVRLTIEGKVNAWLCWHFNRLSRNPVDAGTTIYLMDQGKLDHVRTREKTFWNTAGDKFILSLELSMSKKDSDDKSVLVRSGIRQRNKRGYPTGKPPVGFGIVDRGKKGISSWCVDEERFPLVQELFRRFLKGEDSIRTLVKHAHEIGLTTRPTAGLQGSHPITLSYLHKHILLNPVYAGHFFDANGERYILSEDLPRIISENDFREIQTILKRNTTGGKRSKRTATYRGLLNGDEGRPLSAEVKFQLICDCRKKFSYVNLERCPHCEKEIANLLTPKFLSYTYYYSHKDRLDKRKIARTIEERVLENELRKHFAARLPISPALRDWSIKYLEQLGDSEIEENGRMHQHFVKRRSELEAKKQHLKQLLMDQRITTVDYDDKLAELNNAFEDLDVVRSRAHAESSWLDKAKEILDLAVEFDGIMTHGDVHAKRQAVEALTSNLTWDGNRMSICNAKCVSILENGLEKCRRRNQHFEPENSVENKGQNADFEGGRPTWSRQLNAFRTYFLNKHEEDQMEREEKERREAKRFLRGIENN